MAGDLLQCLDVRLVGDAPVDDEDFLVDDGGDRQPGEDILQQFSYGGGRFLNRPPVGRTGADGGSPYIWSSSP